MLWTITRFRQGLLMATAGLLTACGWVDSGVGGNEPPVTDTADYSVRAGETLAVDAENGVLADDFDQGGRSLTASLVTEPEHASEFTLNEDGSFRYVHDGGDSQSDRFEYAASDAIDESDPTPITIRILHPPVAADDTAGTDSGSPVRIDVLANDSDVDDGIRPGTVRIDDAPAGGTAQPNDDGTITYTPNGDFAGTDTFTYTVADETDLRSNPARVAVTVQAVRPGPSPVDDNEPPGAGPPPPPLNDDDPDEVSEEDRKEQERLEKEREKAEEELAKELEKARREAEKLARRDDDDDDDDDEGEEVDDDDELVAEDDDYDDNGTGIVTVGSLTGVLVNDQSSMTTASSLAGVQASGSTERMQSELITPPLHGRVSLAADGSFNYEAAEPVAAGMDTFTYRARQGDAVSAPATVTIWLGRADACWTIPPGGELSAVLEDSAAADSPRAFRIEREPRFGELSLLDQTTGEFVYRQVDDRSADRFEYSSHVEEGKEQFAAQVLRTPRVLLLGNRPPAPTPEQAAALGDGRFDLQAALRNEGLVADWVGNEQTGQASEFDPDHELHPDWPLQELTWGREGFPVDGLRAWLDRNPADFILLQLYEEPDPAELNSLFDELERWTTGPTGNPVTVLAPKEATAVAQGVDRANLRIIGVDAATRMDPQPWVDALAPHLPRCR